MSTQLLLTSSGMVNNIWFTVHKGLTNKMNNKTSVMMQHTTLCEKRSLDKKSICSRCYSRKLSAYRKKSSMTRYMEHNSRVLREIITTSFTPLATPDGTLRYNSTGDNITDSEVVNIFHHARVNAQLQCAVWTKNFGLYHRVMKSIKPPKNLNLVWSMSRLNSFKFIIPKGFTKSFYVYSKAEILNEAMTQARQQGFSVVECQKQCASCNVCYENKSKQIIMELIR